MKPDFSQYGFVHQENLIMACIGGSQAHGAKLGATDDTDWYGLYTLPPTKVLGLERDEHFVFTTGGKFGGNGPLDVDVCLYTLMKWAGLAAKGNPSALHFLFAPLEFTTKTWEQFSARPELFLAKSHVKPFLRFTDDQMKRLLGQKGQKNVHRAELEDKQTWIRHEVRDACNPSVRRSERVDGARTHHAAETKPGRVDRNP